MTSCFKPGAGLAFRHFGEASRRDRMQDLTPIFRARRTRLACAATALLVLIASACGSGQQSQAQPQQTNLAGSTSKAKPRSPRQLTDLRDIGQLRSLFNTRSGEPRLILLASPT